MDVRSRHRLQTVIHHKCMARANSNAIPTTCAHASMWKYLWPPVTTTSRFTIFSISITIFFSTFVFAPSSNRHMCVIKATGTKMICIRCYVWHFIWAINDMCASIVCTRKRACVIWQHTTHVKLFPKKSSRLLYYQALCVRAVCIFFLFSQNSVTNWPHTHTLRYNWRQRTGHIYRHLRPNNENKQKIFLLNCHCSHAIWWMKLRWHYG